MCDGCLQRTWKHVHVVRLSSASSSSLQYEYPVLRSFHAGSIVHTVHTAHPARWCQQRWWQLVGGDGAQRWRETEQLRSGRRWAVGGVRLLCSGVRCAVCGMPNAADSIWYAVDQSGLKGRNGKWGEWGPVVHRVSSGPSTSRVEQGQRRVPPADGNLCVQEVSHGIR